MSLAYPFLFLRHGQTLWNSQRRVQGGLETALSAAGRAQIETAAAALTGQRIQRIVASPLMRVRATAERVAAPHRLDVDYDPGLGECRLGVGEGQKSGPWLRDYWKGRDTPDGAETFEQFADRAYAALRRAVDREGVLVVAHYGVWRALRAFVRIEPDIALENAMPICVTPGRGVWRISALDGGPIGPTVDQVTV